MLRLTMERLKRGWTKTELAFESRIHPADIGKMESGKAFAYRPHREKLEAVFCIPADELFQEVPEDATGGK